MTDVIDNITIKGFTLFSDIPNDGNAESGIDLRHVQNVVIEDITSFDAGAGTILVAYSKNVKVRNIRINRCVSQNGQTSKGRAFNIWNSYNCDFENIYAENFQAEFLFAESYCKNISFNNVVVVNSHASRDNPNKPIFYVGQGSEVIINNCTIDGNGGIVVVSDGGTTNNYIINNLTLRLTARIKGGLIMSRVKGLFKVSDELTKTFKEYNMNNPKKYRLLINLTDDLYSTSYLPSGLWIDGSLYISTETLQNDFDGVYIGREVTTNGTNRKTTLETEKEKRLAFQFGTDYLAEVKPDERTKIIVDVISTGITGNNKFIVVEVDLVSEKNASYSTVTSTAMKRSFGLV